MLPLDLATLLEPSTFVTQTINGIQRGFILFLIASGLTVILGILDVLNLAHGELFALGAYVSFSVLSFLFGSEAAEAVLVAPPSEFAIVGVGLFLVAVVLGCVIAAAVMFPVGAYVEAVFVRPIYDRDEVYQLLLTFAILLVIADLIQVMWGTSTLSVFPIQQGINTVPTFELVGLDPPSYVAFLIVVGLVLAGGLFYFFDRTKTGRIIRATAIDREMAQAIGVSPRRTFTIVFAFGTFLAGFAGAMQLIATRAGPGMAESALVLSFVVIVVGGLGSLRGAFVGALLVGVVANWMTVVHSALEIAAPFAIMVVVLLVRPEGLFGTWGELE